jgi:RNA polymerase sigma-70 factor (ECF subfamily)
MFPPAALERLRSRFSDGEARSATEIGRELERLWNQARAAWPDVNVDPLRFCETLAPHADSFATLTQLRAKDLYLICACLAGDRPALRAFDALIDTVSGTLGKLAHDPTILAEAKQHARQTVLPRGELPAPLASYNGRGELGGWLRIVLTREILQSLKRGQRTMPLSDEGDHQLALHDQDDPEMAYFKRQYERDFKDAFATAVQELDEDDQRALRYAVVERLTIDDIARIERVHRSTAARNVAQARARLAQRTRELLQERLAIDTTQLESILRLVPSQIDVSVRRLLS